LQSELLREFFAREQRFVLTGGGALIGFHLQHRTSEDIDLFTKPPVDLEDGLRALAAATAALGGTVEPVRTAPEFRRVLVRCGGDSTIVDLVVDRAPEVDPPTAGPGGIRLHTLREIAANKVCALLGRGEIRDLIDLRAILARGLALPGILADAVQKDGGVDAATLAWILDGLRIGAGAVLPGVTAAELDAFRRDLVVQLRALARPAD
jgi:hypothetical protein